MNGALVDSAIIKIKAGNGGDGRVSFRREKFIAKGGPDGGDGGNGGSVYFVGDPNMSTLLDFRSKPNYAAQNGEMGGKKKMFGAAGENLNIRVPLGTQIYEKTSHGDVLISDITQPNAPVLIARGGRGGKGNDRFKSSTNQTPTQYTPGTPGEGKELRLEVKMIADVGLIGLPNAGKSTFINRITSANAKTASYPFTTLVPNLGIYKAKSGSNIVFADIPGLIEGASEGKGLGDEFLKHVERTRILVHIIDPMPFESEETDPVEQSLYAYSVIRKETENYSDMLLEKKELVAINKIDITEIRNSISDIQSAFKNKGINTFAISAATGEGLEPLLDKVTEELSKVSRIAYDVEELPKVYNISDLPNKRIVHYDDNVLEHEKAL